MGGVGLVRLMVLIGSFFFGANSQGVFRDAPRPLFDDIPNPWIIAEEVRITNPMDLGDVIVVAR